MRAGSIGVAAGALLAGMAIGHAADMKPILKAPPPVVAPPFSWSGFYLGLHAGGIWGETEIGGYNDALFPPFATRVGETIFIILGQTGTLPATSGRDTAWLAGGQAGFNWQVNQFVLGIEADASATGLDITATASAIRFPGTTVSQTVTVAYATDVDWTASLRGRIGVAFDRFMVYATGGGAVAAIDVNATTTLVNGPAIFLPAGAFAAAASTSETRFGWTGGFGFEWAFNNNWSFGAEYRHSDFGTFTATNLIQIPSGLGPPTFATGSTDVKLTTDQVTARLNWRLPPR